MTLGLGIVRHVCKSFSNDDDDDDYDDSSENECCVKRIPTREVEPDSSHFTPEV